MIVPPEARNRVLAVEGALENSLANILGANMVPYISWFFYGFNLDDIPQGSGEKDLDAAIRIGYALGTTCALPWLAAYLIYSLLHWTCVKDITLIEPKDDANQFGPRSSFLTWQYKATRCGTDDIMEQELTSRF